MDGGRSIEVDSEVTAGTGAVPSEVHSSLPDLHCVGRQSWHAEDVHAFFLCCFFFNSVLLKMGSGGGGTVMGMWRPHASLVGGITMRPSLVAGNVCHSSGFFEHDPVIRIVYDHSVTSLVTNTEQGAGLMSTSTKQMHVDRLSFQETCCDGLFNHVLCLIGASTSET